MKKSSYQLSINNVYILLKIRTHEKSGGGVLPPAQEIIVTMVTMPLFSLTPGQANTNVYIDYTSINLIKFRNSREKLMGNLIIINLFNDRLLERTKKSG